MEVMIMDRLPNNFLVEGELTHRQLMILLEQISRFNKLKSSYSKVGSPSMDVDGNLNRTLDF